MGIAQTPQVFLYCENNKQNRTVEETQWAIQALRWRYATHDSI
jgi:hypothetical protein